MTNVLPPTSIDGEHQTIASDDGVNLSFRLWKRPSQDAVLFIHGLRSSQEQFASDAAFFADTGYCAANVDLRGHGLSSSPVPWSSETLTLDCMAKDTLGLLTHIPAQKIHIFGNSLGGLVGLKLLENGSDRIASQSTGGTAFRLKMFPAAAELSYEMLKLLGPTWLANIVAKRMISNPKARPFVQKLMNADNPELIRHIQKNIACYDYEPIASNFAGPLLILRGELDSAINKGLDFTWERLCDKPNTKLVNFPGVGHFTNLDNPKLFRIALLSFFSKISTDALGSSEI